MSAPVDMLAVKLLRGFQSSFGPSRPDDDEDDAEVWDQIDAACESLAELIDKADTAATVLSNLIAAGQVDAGYSGHVTDLTAALARVGGAS